MKTVFDARMRTELVDRLKQLTPETERRWGSMTSVQMVTHLADSLKMAFGDLAVKSKKTPLRFPVLKQFVIYLAPFPKGVPTAPELIARTATDLSVEVASVETLLERFAKTELRLHPEHPVFGQMSAREWGVLIYRHTDHHLRQFGV